MDVIELKKIANEVRKGIVTSVHSAKAGHPGGSLSAADVFTYLYFEEILLSVDHFINTLNIIFDTLDIFHTFNAMSMLIVKNKL